MAGTNEEFRASYYDWGLSVRKGENGEWALRLESPDGLAIDGGRSFLFEDDGKSEALELAQTYFA